VSRVPRRGAQPGHRSACDGDAADPSVIGLAIAGSASCPPTAHRCPVRARSRRPPGPAPGRRGGGRGLLPCEHAGSPGCDTTLPHDMLRQWPVTSSSRTVAVAGSNAHIHDRSCIGLREHHRDRHGPGSGSGVHPRRGTHASRSSPSLVAILLTRTTRVATVDACDVVSDLEERNGPT